MTVTQIDCLQYAASSRLAVLIARAAGATGGDMTTIHSSLHDYLTGGEALPAILADDALLAGMAGLLLINLLILCYSSRVVTETGARRDKVVQM